MDPVILSKVPNHLLVIFRQSETCKRILLLADVVGFNDSCEYRETVLRVQANVKVVAVDTSHLNLFTGSGSVD
jgi:hypothetical protein